MSLQFVIGRAGTGKSEYCLNEIRHELKQSPQGNPLVLLVPEQATFQAELALVSTPGLGGILRAQVLSFRRLAWRVMQEAGGTARLPIDEIGKNMLLHKILHKRKSELKLFHTAAEQPGFVDRLQSLFTELKRYTVSANELEGYANELTRGTKKHNALLNHKLHDLQLVLSSFEEELAATYLDGEDCLSLLAEQFQDSSYAVSASYWIDGFHGFTPQEFAVMEKMFQSSQGTTVTLTLHRDYEAGEQPNDLELFHPTAKTMIKLKEIVNELNLEAPQVIVLSPDNSPRYSASPALAYLEQSLVRRGLSPYSADVNKQIIVNAAVNRRAEAEGLAREMVRLVREEGARWRELSVRVRNLEGYSDLLSTVFNDYSIPYYVDQKTPVMHHPLVEFVRSALDTVRGGWKYDAVFRCVKTDFFLPLSEAEEDADIDRLAMDRLENFVLAFGIHGYRWTDGKAWQLSIKDWTEEGEAIRSEKDLQLEDQMNRCRKRIATPLHHFQKQIARATNVKEMTEALFGLLEQVQAPERLEAWSENAIIEGKPHLAREHTQVWGYLLDVMDQLVEMMGEEEASLDLYSKLMETGLESLSLRLVPPSLDQVLIGTLDRTRSGQVKYAFILGVNDGVLPARPKEDGVLTEKEREIMMDAGVPMADSARRKLLDEQFIVYNALSMASHRLWISYTLADEEGKALLPSEVMRKLKRTFPNVKEELLMAEPSSSMTGDEQLDYVRTPERAMTYLALQLKQWMKGTEIEAIWWEVYNWFATRQEWRNRLETMVRSLFYNNKEERLEPATSKELYGSHLKASVSRMERFVSCPFSQFASYGLKLRERKIYRLEAPDIGQLFHEALSRVASGIALDKLQWGKLSPEEIFWRASAVVDSLAPRLQGEILLSSKRYHYIARKLKQIVGRAAVILGEHSKKSVFEPVGLELPFGNGGKIPPLTFQLDNGCSMEIIGRIDRVDQAIDEGKTLLRVIDYKSSETHLHLAEVYYGLALQMLTYLDVAVSNSTKWLGTQASPAGVLYFHVHNPILQLKNGIPPQQAEKEMKKRFKMKGLLIEDTGIVKLMDADLDGNNRSDLLPVEIKKDGTFGSRSSVASEARWEQLRGLTRNKIQSIGTEITNGAVDIQPYRIGNKTACTHCSYKPVCHFDPLFEGNEFKILKQRGKEEIWQALEESKA